MTENIRIVGRWGDSRREHLARMLVKLWRFGSQSQIDENIQRERRAGGAKRTISERDPARENDKTTEYWTETKIKKRSEHMRLTFSRYEPGWR